MVSAKRHTSTSTNPHQRGRSTVRLLVSLLVTSQVRVPSRPPCNSRRLAVGEALFERLRCWVVVPSERGAICQIHLPLLLLLLAMYPWWYLQKMWIPLAIPQQPLHHRPRRLSLQRHRRMRMAQTVHLDPTSPAKFHTRQIKSTSQNQ